MIEPMNEELKLNNNVLKKLQDVIVHMKDADENIRNCDKTKTFIFDDIVKLLEESVVRISRLEKGLQWSVDTINNVDTGDYVKSGNELKWARSLVEKDNDNDNSS